MKNNITELVFILDKSGSMCGMESDTVGGFNSTVAKQKKLEGKVYVSTVLFSNESEVLHDRVDIQSIEPMRTEDFTAAGCTALLDAIGGAIHHIGNVHKYAREEDVPEHTIFVIMTDGMENASHLYSSDEVKAMVEKGEFREDLFYRLSVVDLHLPPLRERKSEIPGLVEYFIREFARDNMKDVSGITPEAMEKLISAPWHGNIRELRNCVERMVVLASGGVLDVSDVPESASSAPTVIRKEVENPLNLESSEKELIRKALAECGNNRAAAARKLGISRRTLYRKLEDMENESASSD